MLSGLDSAELSAHSRHWGSLEWVCVGGGTCWRVLAVWFSSNWHDASHHHLIHWHHCTARLQLLLLLLYNASILRTMFTCHWQQCWIDKNLMLLIVFSVETTSSPWQRLQTSNCDWSMEIQHSANNSLSVQMSQHATSQQSFYTMLSLTAWVVVLYCALVCRSICPFKCRFSRVTQPLWQQATNVPT